MTRIITAYTKRFLVITFIWLAVASFYVIALGAPPDSALMSAILVSLVPAFLIGQIKMPKQIDRTWPSLMLSLFLIHVPLLFAGAAESGTSGLIAVAGAVIVLAIGYQFMSALRRWDKKAGLPVSPMLSLAHMLYAVSLCIVPLTVSVLFLDGSDRLWGSWMMLIAGSFVGLLTSLAVDKADASRRIAASST